MKQQRPQVKIFLISVILFAQIADGQVIPFSFWKPFSTLNKSWTWVAGSSGYNSSGAYGTKGTGSTSNYPGARFSSGIWSDSVGNIWLFGGSGYDSNGNFGTLNDLWEYTPSTSQWTWVSGSSLYDITGTYGTKGTPSASTVAGCRQAPFYWTDTSGNFWLYGGLGYGNYYNDLWTYNLTTGQWTWVSGSSASGSNGVYGTKGTGSTSNFPGGRYNSGASWVDNSGNFWLFGGEGYPASGSTIGSMNDLWEYVPGSKTWTWITGVNTLNASSTCGTEGTGSTANSPGARYGATTWADTFGNLWLFGGSGYDGTGTSRMLDDLWKFTPSSSKWTWVSGNCNAGNGGVGTFGTKGVAAAANMPEAREFATSWTDSSGNLWLFGGWTGGYELNELWEYSITTGYWTWIAGAEDTNQTGVYGVKGVTAATNYPGSRSFLNTVYIGNSLWFFGGQDQTGQFNDLWQAQ